MNIDDNPMVVRIVDFDNWLVFWRNLIMILWCFMADLYQSQSLGCLLTDQTLHRTKRQPVQYFGKKSIWIPTEPAPAKMGRVLPDDDDDDYSNNPLLQKLQQQSINNKEWNDLEIEQKTFENNPRQQQKHGVCWQQMLGRTNLLLSQSLIVLCYCWQSANFSPLDWKVLIMNADGWTFTLLENLIAMYLKQAGFIDNHQVFIQQPTAKDIAKAEQDAWWQSGFERTGGRSKNI
jgi:hypothetical protein